MEGLYFDKNNAQQDYIRVICCPDCNGGVKEIIIKDMLFGFFCEKCKLIHPIKEGIIILLSKNIRNYNLEYGVLQDIEKKLSDKDLKKYVANTLKLVQQSKGSKKSWEWEDEEHWNKMYNKESHSKVEKSCKHRIWEREFFMESIDKNYKLNDKTILDVGCGGGENFRFILSRHCNKNSLYIAADISFEGLKLNRSWNCHDNSWYILTSANNLPFHKNTIDFLCYFGILHHTERKAATISEDCELVKKGGYMLAHEVLYRTPFRSFLPKSLRSSTERSTHEESIVREELYYHIEKANLKIINSKEFLTLFMGLMIKFFPKLAIERKFLWRFFSSLDILILKAFRRKIVFFKPGEVMILLKNIN